MLDLREGVHDPLRHRLLDPKLERFIGVIYRPETERWSHYSGCSLPQQLDAWVWFDETTAVTPLPTGRRRAWTKPGRSGFEPGYCGDGGTGVGEAGAREGFSNSSRLHSSTTARSPCEATVDGAVSTVPSARRMCSIRSPSSVST